MGLLLAPTSWAAESSAVASHTVQCPDEPRCVAAVRNALEAAKTNKKEALRLMLLIHAEFPDPRLFFNIGRLYQQTGEPDQASRYFRQFLAGAAEHDRELLAKAHLFLEQAEKDAQLSLPTATLPPEPSPASRVVPAAATRLPTPLARDGRQATHPAWRYALAATLMGSGLLSVGVGAAALQQDGMCDQFSSATFLMQRSVCLRSLHTTEIGAGLIAAGGAVALAGVISIVIPARKKAPLVASKQPTVLSPGPAS